jgi:hypothetical protein
MINIFALLCILHFVKVKGFQLYMIKREANDNLNAWKFKDYPILKLINILTAW